jgi:hypothetical protein
VKRAAILALVAAMGATAESFETPEPSITTDRPGFTTGPNVLARGFTQLEGGISLAVDEGGRTFTLGSPLLRVGVARRLELRVAGDGFLCRPHDMGWSDVTLGAKLGLLQERNILPAISLLPSVSVPAGYRAFTSSKYDLSLAVAWQKTLIAGLALAGTLDGKRSATAFSFPALAGASGYVEIYTLGGEGISDAGLSRGIGPNLQVDIEAGRRIFSGKPSWFIATGFALRRPLFKR